MTIGGILENLVADAIFVAALVPIATTVILAATRWRSHARLLRFLGCDGEDPEVVVFFSTLVVQRGGAVDFRGVPRSYNAPVVPESEFLLSRVISAALEVPGQDWFTRLLALAIRHVPGRGFRRWLGPRHVRVRYDLSPLQVPVPLPATVTICLGSNGTNYATDFYLSNLAPLLTFGPGPNPDIRQPGGPRVSYAGDVGMLQRLTTTFRYPVFIAAGIGTNGTSAALRYLFTHWQDIERKFGAHDFALALGCPPFIRDPFGFHDPALLLELSR